MAGRPKKAPSLKVFEGDKSKGSGKQNKAKPARTTKRPKMPHSVSRCQIAKAFWNHLCECLDELGVLHIADRTILEFCCIDYSIMRKNLKAVGSKYVLTGPNGGDYINPAYSVAIGAEKRLDTRLHCLGLTPKARQNMDVEMPRIPTPGQSVDGPVGGGGLSGFAASRGG